MASAVILGSAVGAGAGWTAVRPAGWGGAVPATLVGLGLAAIAVAVCRSSRWLLALASVAFTVTAVELATSSWERFLRPPEKAYRYHHTGVDQWFGEHRLVGFALRGPATLWATATIGDDVIYSEVRYDLDELGRRGCDPVPTASRHALFFGGSFTFGEGLANAETLPCRFQQASAGRYSPRSYAMMGWGPAQSAVILGVDALFDDVYPREGVAVFSFIGDHVNRTVWRPGWSTDYPYFPLYDLDDEGRLVGPIRGAELERGTAVDRAVRMLTRESTVFRALALPVLQDRVNDPRAVRITAMVLAEAAARYRERFNGQFIVLLWPRAQLSPELDAILVSELERRRVVVVRVDPLPGDPSEALLHPRDSHPSAREVEWVARELCDAIDCFDP